MSERERVDPRRSRRGERRAASSPGSAVTAASLIATLAAASNLGAVAAGARWWLLAAIIGAVALAAAAVVRRWRPVWPLPLMTALIVAFAGILLAFAGPTLAYGILPVSETWARIEQLVYQAIAHIASQSMPAAPNEGLDLILVTGIVTVAILIETFAVSARLPVLAGIPLLALAIIPGRAANEPVELVGAGATILAVLALVWLDRRRDVERPSLVAAAGVAMVAVVGGVVGQAVAPAFDDSTASGATLRPVFSTGADPLVRLGDHLRRGAEVTALRYRTTSSEPVYLRVVTIDDLSGEEWRTSALAEEGTAERGIETFPTPPGLSESVAREAVRTSIEDAFARRLWLPVPYPAISVSELEGADRWAWDPDSLAVGAIDEGTRADDYTVTSYDVFPTQEQLRSAPPVSSIAFERYLALPADAPPSVAETTAQVTADVDNPYDRALAIQRFLRGSEFTYDEDTPEEADGDGDSFDVIATFLEERRGYCVHFASAMTVMARQLGIPARIAVGYQPGDRQITQANSYEVTSHDLHAWPELYFEGAGWTRFEPTPGRGDVPAYTQTDREASESEEQQETEPTPTTSAPVRDNDPGTTTGGSAQSSSWIGVVALAVGIPLAGVLLIGAPAIVRLLRRRMRLASIAEGRVSAAWDELQGTAIDLRVTDERLSPRMLDHLLATSGSLSVDELRLLSRWREATEQERFGRPDTASTSLRDAAVSRASVEMILRSLRRSVTRSKRMLAWALPRSLWRRGEARPSPNVPRSDPAH